LELEVPLVYFVGTRPGWYRPIYPVFVTVDDPANAHVIAAPGVISGSMDEPEPAPIVDIGERRTQLGKRA